MGLKMSSQPSDFGELGRAAVSDPLAPGSAAERTQKQIDRKIQPPRSAYIHVPFCRHRCGYCNFTLLAGRGDLIEPFLAALEIELSWLGQPHEVDTLFLGGGTPTHLRGQPLRRLLEIVMRWHPLANRNRARNGGQNAEFSVEANPADLDAETIAMLADYGVTRISLGAQSFHSEKLRLLERDHQPGDIAKAVQLARNRGLDVSLDLMFGAPGETLAAWQSDLHAALQLAPDHISTYGLTFERGTAFWSRLQRGALAKVDEETERQMYADAIDRLTAAGFEHYEVSNFARPGKRCRHNEVYWTGGEYFAAGPGAARHVAGVRETNHKSVTKWLRCMETGQSPVAEREYLPPEDKARELLVFGLRRLEGVRRDWFFARTGHEIDALVGKPLGRFVAAGLLTDDGCRIQLTRAGLFVSDSLWPEFLQK
ncbi:MAG TPA: radical SAM family heme chaperone HemW [Pirellulales bacterium]|nr:radical SAM family heme chaperone HemW [Pirellulales bacterium]